jgi:hypothetical protein
VGPGFGTSLPAERRRLQRVPSFRAFVAIVALEGPGTGAVGGPRCLPLGMALTWLGLS